MGGTQVSYDEGSSGLTSVQSLARGSRAGSPAFRPRSPGINRQVEWLSFVMLLPGLQHLGLKCFSWMFYEISAFIIASLVAEETEEQEDLPSAPGLFLPCPAPGGEEQRMSRSGLGKQI